jgi:ribosomal protein L11
LGWSALLLVSECSQALAPDLDAAVRTIAGTARSMGVDVEGL